MGGSEKPIRTNRVRLLVGKEIEAELLLLGDRVSALWNASNYRLRQTLFASGISALPPVYKLESLMRSHETYRALPSDIAQETVKKLSEAWKSHKRLRTLHVRGELEQRPGLVRYRKRKDGSRPFGLIPIKSDRSYSVGAHHFALVLPADRRKECGERLQIPYRGLRRYEGKKGRAELRFDSGRGRWYLSFAVTTEKSRPKSWQRGAAIDLGVRVLLSLSVEGVDQSVHFSGREVLRDWDWHGRKIAQHQRELSHRPRAERSSRRLRRIYQRRRARLRHAWEAIAARVVSECRRPRVGVVYLGWPKGILRHTSYAKLWRGRIHGFWSFEVSLSILEKHLRGAGIQSHRVGEQGSSSHCPFCDSKDVVRRPRHVLRCREPGCGLGLHSDQAGSRNILKENIPRVSWDALEARARPETRRWNSHRWEDTSNRSSELLQAG